MTNPERRPAAAVAAGFLWLLAACLPTFAQTPQSAAPVAAAPAGDFITFEELRHSDRVESDGRIERVQQVKVLLRDAAAVAELGQIGMMYVDGYGDVRFEDVWIEKPDGRRIEIKNGIVEDVNPFGMTGTSISADVRFKKLTLPGLEPGDRLSYRLVTPQKPLVPGRVFGEVKFVPVPSDPTQVYELDLPRDAQVTVELRKDLGVSWEDVPAPADRIKRRLSVRPRRPDFGEAGPSWTEAETFNQPDVTFTTFRSWTEVAEWWWRLSEDRLQPDAAIRTQAAELVQGKTSARDKLDALLAFVASRVRYLNVNFGLGRMQPRLAGDVLAKKYGDCKDKVALLSALASAVGIDVRPVLVHSARQHLLDAAPGPQQFDHMIAVARLSPRPDGWLWLDATNELGPAGYLVRGLRDQPALLVERNGTGLIVRTPASAPFKQRIEAVVKGTLPADGPLQMHVQWTFRTDTEAVLRDAFRRTPPEKRAEFVTHTLGRAWRDARITNVSTSPPSDVSQPFRIDFDAEHTLSGRSSDKEWALSVPLPGVQLPDARKGVSADEKATEFFADEYVVRAEIELPEGVTGRAPLSLSIDRPYGRFTSDYSITGRLLKIERRLAFLKPEIKGSESASYTSFREAFDKDREQDFWIDPKHDGALAAAPGAAVLHADGLSAFAKKDYGKAIELFEKSVAADPKVKDGYNDLGRVLREHGRKQDALGAFTRQIEIDPFHESAYAERAYLLLDMDRREEAEKDLLKQIEVAPFKPWSYGKLADIRMGQLRFDEAAGYFERATALEPRRADTWQKLGWTHAVSGRTAQALSALQRARGLKPDHETARMIAMALDFVGDAQGAGEMAEGALTRLTELSTKVAPASFGDKDRFDTQTLVEFWRLTGTNALASGDLLKAERYLTAAWESGLRADAGWQLGLLRERQKRPKEAATLWSAAAVTGDWWRRPADLDKRLAAALPPDERFPGRPTTYLNSGRPVVGKLREVPLPGTPRDQLTEEVLLLIGPGGKVEGVRNLSGRNKAAFARVLPQVVATKVPFSWPDEKPGKLVRRGLLSCHPLSTCSLMFDLGGARPLHFK